MDYIRPPVHLRDRGFLPAVDQNAHGIADLESARPGPRLRIDCSCGSIAPGSRMRPKRRRRWRNFAAMRIGLRFGRGLRVAFCRKQSRQLYAEGFSTLECLALFVVLVIACTRGVGARKYLEALSVGAHIHNIHLQRWRLRERAGCSQHQQQASQTEYAHLWTASTLLRVSRCGW